MSFNKNFCANKPFSGLEMSGDSALYKSALYKRACNYGKSGLKSHGGEHGIEGKEGVKDVNDDGTTTVYHTKTNKKGEVKKQSKTNFDADGKEIGAIGYKYKKKGVKVQYHTGNEADKSKTQTYFTTRDAVASNFQPPSDK